MSIFERQTAAFVKSMTKTIVDALSAKYGFDSKEAIQFLNGKSKEAIPLPFCNTYNEACCAAIVCNKQLYTQCTNKRAGETEFCTKCGDGKKYGDIRERIDNENWTTPNGKKPVKYATYAKKHNIVLEEAIAWARTNDQEIPEHELKEEIKEKKPKKTKEPKEETSSDESSSNEEKPVAEKKKKGRPSKKTEEPKEESSSDEEKPVVAEKKKRGRPSKKTEEPKEDSSSDEEKPVAEKKRGRPSKKTEEPKEETSSDDSSSNEEKPVVAEKKKKGRPSKKTKEPKEKTSSDESSSNEEKPVEKKKQVVEDSEQDEEEYEE